MGDAKRRPTSISRTTDTSVPKSSANRAFSTSASRFSRAERLPQVASCSIVLVAARASASRPAYGKLVGTLRLEAHREATSKLVTADLALRTVGQRDRVVAPRLGDP